MVCIILPSKLDLPKSARSVVRVPGNETADYGASGAGATIRAPHGARGPGPPGTPRAARRSHLLAEASATPVLSGWGAPLYIAPALRRVRLVATSCVLRVVIAPVVTSASARSLNTRPVSQDQVRAPPPGCSCWSPPGGTLSGLALDSQQQLTLHNCHGIDHIHMYSLS